MSIEVLFKSIGQTKDVEITDHNDQGKITAVPGLDGTPQKVVLKNGFGNEAASISVLASATGQNKPGSPKLLEPVHAELVEVGDSYLPAGKSARKAS